MSFNNFNYVECKVALKFHRAHESALQAYALVLRDSAETMINIIKMSDDAKATEISESLKKARDALLAANQLAMKAVNISSIGATLDTTGRFFFGWKQDKSKRSKDDVLILAADEDENELQKLEKELQTAQSDNKKLREENSNVTTLLNKSSDVVNNIRKIGGEKLQHLLEFVANEPVSADDEKDLLNLFANLENQLMGVDAWLKNACATADMDVTATLDDSSGSAGFTRRTARDGSSSRVKTDSSKHKLDNTTPIFGKDPSWKVADWLFVVENNLAMKDIPANKKLMVVAPFLRGTAFQMLKRFMTEKRLDWDEFRQELVTTFQPPDHERTMRTQLLNLRQDSSFQKYSQDFQYYATQITSMSEKDKLACFLQGLRTRTQIELVYKDVKTLSEAIKLAASLELVRDKPKQDNGSVSDRLREAGSKGQFSFKYGSGKKTNEPSTPRPSVVCLKCKKTGHYANKCPVKSNVPPSSSTSDKSERKFNTPSRITCWNCGKTGHKTSECRIEVIGKSNCLTFSVDDPRKAMVLALDKCPEMKVISRLGCLEGISILIGFDTGATLSVVSLETVKRHCLSYEPSDMK